MNRFVVLLVTIVTLLVAGSSVATADVTPGNTCGTSGSQYDAFAGSINYANGQFLVTVYAECGTHATFEWEAQKSTDNGLHWGDIVDGSGVIVDHQINTGTTDCHLVNPCQYDRSPNAGCNSANAYRLKVWNYADRNDVLNLHSGGGNGC